MDKIKSLFVERQARVNEYQQIHANAEKMISDLLEKAGILDRVQKITAEREVHRQRLQSSVDHLTGKIEALMEAAGLTEEDVRAAFTQDQSPQA